MADEDKIQKRMEFIVEQQAQFASEIVELKDIVSRLANASSQRIENLEDKVSALVDAQTRTEGNLSALAQAQSRTDERLNALAESQAHTDERLNALINVVERYIGHDRNGNSQG